MKKFFLPEPVIFAQKGGVPDVPGNTMPAFRKSIEAGADVIAIHIRITKDKQLIVTDRDALETGTGVTVPVHQCTLEEIKTFDAAVDFKDPQTGEYSFRGKGIRYITLDEALQEFPEQRFNVDLMDRDTGLVPAFCECVQRRDAEQRLLVTSQYGSNIKQVRKKLPGMATSFSILGMVGIYALFRSGLLYFSGKFRADALQVPESVGPSYIANQALVRECVRKGLRVHVFVDNKEHQIRRLHESGVNGFFSDDIVRLREILKSI